MTCDMTWLCSIGLHNAAVAVLLAPLVWSVTRIWKNPPVAHLMWLLVLVKLVTPPVVNLDLWKSGTAPVQAGNEQADLAFGVPPPIVEGSQVAPSGAALNPLPGEKSTSVASAAAWSTIRPLLMDIWVGGVGLVALLAGIRVVQFQRMLAGTLPASRRLQSVTDELATRMGLRQSPDVRVVDGAAAPLVWCLGRRATVILPLRLLGVLDQHQTAMVLAHELAHLRRRDHWVRVVELLVSVLHWWNPLVWWVRRRLHAVEEQCCDSWVAWVYPDESHDYAECLLKAAELSPSHRSRLVLASPFLNSHTLKERIEMVLKNRSKRTASRRAAVGLALLAAVVVPAGVRGAAEGRGPTVEGRREATSPNEETKAAVVDPVAGKVGPVAGKVDDRGPEIDAAIARLRQLGAFVREFHPRGNPQYWVQVISTDVGAATRDNAENFDDAALDDVEVIARGVALDLHLRRTSITAAGLERLVSAGRINHLALTGPNIDDAMLRVLPKLPLQGQLGLASDLLTNAGIQSVSECRQLTGVSSACGVGNTTMKPR